MMDSDPTDNIYLTSLVCNRLPGLRHSKLTGQVEGVASLSNLAQITAG